MQENKKAKGEAKKRIAIFRDFYAEKMKNRKEEAPESVEERPTLEDYMGRGKPAVEAVSGKEEPVLKENAMEEKANNQENIEFKKQAFQEIKEKLRSRFEQFLEENPKLKDKINPEEFLDEVVNKMLRNDDHSYDILEGIAGKKQKGEKGSFIEKENFGKLIKRFYYIAEDTKKKILAEPKKKEKSADAPKKTENKEEEKPKKEKEIENKEKIEKEIQGLERLCMAYYEIYCDEEKVNWEDYSKEEKDNFLRSVVGSFARKTIKKKSEFLKDLGEEERNKIIEKIKQEIIQK
jgi:hypothetical protein